VVQGNKVGELENLRLYSMFNWTMGKHRSIDDCNAPCNFPWKISIICNSWSYFWQKIGLSDNLDFYLLFAVKTTLKNDLRKLNAFNSKYNKYTYYV
jgi:hypothetical protein